MTELPRDVCELDADAEQLTREGVAQILGLVIREADCLAEGLKDSPQVGIPRRRLRESRPSVVGPRSGTLAV